MQKRNPRWEVWWAALALLLVVICGLRALEEGEWDIFTGPDVLQKKADDLKDQGGPAAGEPVAAWMEAALRKDPASPYRWCDLGEAYLALGKKDPARACFRRALELGPRIPPVWMRVANFHLQMGEQEGVLRSTARVLALVPDYDQLIFSYYGLVDADVPTVLRYGMPEDRRAGTAFLRHLMAAGGVPDMQAAWEWTTKRGSVNDVLAGEYASALVAKRAYGEAAAAWAQHVGARRGAYLRPERLYNGDFEHPPTGTIFDWRIVPLEGVVTELDPTERFSGKQSLRIHFEGQANLVYAHVSQSAWVTPATYRFQARLRTDGITTNKGVRFRIFDPEAPARLDLATEEFTGTRDWVLVEKVFATPAGTNLVTVQVARDESLKFDNKIQGTVWIDAVSLAPVGDLRPRIGTTSGAAEGPPQARRRGPRPGL